MQPAKATIVTRRRSNLWLRLERQFGDKPIRSWAVLIVFVLSLVGLGIFLGGGQRPSIKYSVDAWKAFRFGNFGGAQEINDTTQIYDSLKHWDREDYDQMDVAANSLYAFPTLFREQIEQVISRNGRVRILVLDPRLVDTLEGRRSFGKLAEQFGVDPYVLLTESKYTAASLIAMRKKLGERFEARFYSRPDMEATGGFFLPSRSYHKYNQLDSSKRLDVIVPYTTNGTGAAARGKGVLRVKDRPENEQVKRCTEVFERMWPNSVSIDELMNDSVELLHGEWNK